MRVPYTRPPEVTAESTVNPGGHPVTVLRCERCGMFRAFTDMNVDLLISYVGEHWAGHRNGGDDG